MIKICIKDLKLFFSDKKGVLLSFLLPIALITLFALAFGGMGGGRSEFNPIALPIVNLDSTKTVEKIIADIDSTKELIVENTGLENGKELVKKGNRIGILVFYNGFEDSLKTNKELPMELMYDEAREIEMGMLQSVLISNLMQNIGTTAMKQDIKTNVAEQYPNMDQDELKVIFNNINAQFEDGFGGNDMNLKLTSIVGETKDANLGLIQAVAGVAVLMLLFSVTAIGSGLLEEKEQGTLKKLLYSPIKKNNILYGKMLAGLFVSILQLAIMFIFAWLAFGLNLGIDIPSLILMIIATAFACSSFGIFLASIAKSRQQIQSLSMIIILVMSAIGGSMIPLFIMPAFMQNIAVVSVNYWAIQGFYDIFWRELAFADVSINAAVLFGIGIFVSIISVFMFKRNVLKIL